MDNRRDPYDLGDTLGDLVAQHDTATGEGERGSRRRPRFQSEEQRVRLTIDVDLEPSVAAVLARLAAQPPEAYGPGEIRPGDLATVALITGLRAFQDGDLDIVAEWTARSRGKRNLALGKDLDHSWVTVVQQLKIERWPA